MTSISFDLNNNEELTFKTLDNIKKVYIVIVIQLFRNTDEITDGLFEGVAAFILPNPRAKLNVSEVEAIGNFITSGGAVLVLLSEGGEQQADTNINFLLEEFGIVGNSDAVIRSIFYKYFDPKEALILNGVLNRSVALAAKKTVTNDQQVNSHSSTCMARLVCNLGPNITPIG
ncbi:hypothetical protein DICVIV_06933 [Dictyocaulus viviparus]|uniref:IFT52 GIFT domain-containing protein n=1 Tax=Dictyocaulus viviparus TaxID=29172 RepID=A0A0D8XQQ8_DICVI|nr:hypothetical protein DICVIV_06933 [Dictyocaulus viviparus]